MAARRPTATAGDHGASPRGLSPPRRQLTPLAADGRGCGWVGRGGRDDLGWLRPPRPTLLLGRPQQKPTLSGAEVGSLNRKAAVRIGPAVGGRFLASPWRFWAQGDQFYAAGLNTITHGKVSFHSGGRWYYTVGHKMKQLARPLVFPNGWLLAAQVQFMSCPAEVPPAPSGHDAARKVELPARHKLVVTLLTRSEPSRTRFPPIRGIDGTVLASHRLRSGIPWVVLAAIAPMTEADLEIAQEHYSKLSVTIKGDYDVAAMLRAEITRPFRSPQSGNVFAVMVAAVPVTKAPAGSAERSPG